MLTEHHDEPCVRCLRCGAPTRLNLLAVGFIGLCGPCIEDEKLPQPGDVCPSCDGNCGEWTVDGDGCRLFQRCPDCCGTGTVLGEDEDDRPHFLPAEMAADDDGDPGDCPF